MQPHRILVLLLILLGGFRSSIDCDGQESSSSATIIKERKAATGNARQPQSLQLRLRNSLTGHRRQVAVIAGAKRVGDYLNVLGLIDDVGDIYLGIRNFHQDEKPGNVRWQGRAKKVSQMIVKVNSIFTRMEKGVALAH